MPCQVDVYDGDEWNEYTIHYNWEEGTYQMYADITAVYSLGKKLELTPELEKKALDMLACYLDNLEGWDEND